MKCAIISDIHGHYIALQNVLEDPGGKAPTANRADSKTSVEWMFWNRDI